MANWVRYPLPILSVSPVESIRRGCAIPPPPPTKEVSQRYLRDTLWKKMQNACDTLLGDTISKGYCAIWGGISHWAAKHTSRVHTHADPLTKWLLLHGERSRLYSLLHGYRYKSIPLVNETLRRLQDDGVKPPRQHWFKIRPQQQLVERSTEPFP